jgi:hypothetical protein
MRSGREIKTVKLKNVLHLRRDFELRIYICQVITNQSPFSN